MVSFLALLDDIAALLDDTATMTQVAAKKTASILGDDLAVNAEQSSKFSAKREVVAVKKIALGAFKNKIILLPLIALLGYFLPSAIVILLIFGGLFLSYEGVHGLHDLFGSHSSEEDDETDSEKIKGAIRTDFVLSIEIIVIAFSTVLDKPFIQQMITVSVVAIGAVAFVYGLVFFIIRLDDIGLWLITKGWKKTGSIFVASLKWITISLKYIGVFAMFLVAGGIFAHHIHHVHEFQQHTTWYLSLLIDLGLALVAGYILVNIEKIYKSFH
jgi:predicted DNA repair protein MutK